MNSDALQFLADKGLSIAEIIEFARISERKKDATNAERQARYRENKRNAVTVTPVTEEEKTDEVSPQTPLPITSTPVTPKGVTAPKGAKRNRGSKIDLDWQPPAIADLPPNAKSLASLWTAASYAAEAEAFRNYWLGETGTKASKADWRATWCNRIVQIHSKVMRDQKFGNAAPDSPPPPVKDRAAMIADAEKRVEQFARLGRADDAAAAERFLQTLKSTGPPLEPA